MQLTVRYIQSKGTTREINEVVFNGDRATIGRGSDQTIQVQDRRVPLAHSMLILSENRLELKAERGQSFTHNNQSSRQKELVPGDLVDILGHELRVLPSEEGAGFLIEMEIKISDVEPLRNRFTTGLKQLRFPVRALSWGMFWLILSVGVLIPSVGFFVGMDVLRDSPLPDDSQWLTGELHASHALLSNECDACHVVPFEPARDQECLACHENVTQHFDANLLGSSDNVHANGECRDCHRDHNGPDGIVRYDQKLCADCHSDLSEIGLESSSLGNATDFLENHPPFKVSVLEMSPNQSWDVSRLALSSPDLIESSNLKFPHDVHVSEEGIEGLDSVVVLTCDSCHVAEKGGLSMKPVTMEKHCADCHQLTFDPDAPDRVVPHGSPKDLLQQLEGFYAYEFFQQEGQGLDPQAKVNAYNIERLGEQRDARRPGRRRDRQVINAPMFAQTASNAMTQQAKETIDLRVADAAANLFERQTCTICHEISPQEGDVPWKVLPVKLTDDWMPLAEFSHDSHVSMDCGGCHEAETSADASDVLMPDIKNCQECHGGEHSEDLLQSTCITCHKFHLDNQEPMTAQSLFHPDGVLADRDFLAGLGKEWILEAKLVKDVHGKPPVGNEKSSGQ